MGPNEIATIAPAPDTLAEVLPAPLVKRFLDYVFLE